MLEKIKQRRWTLKRWWLLAAAYDFYFAGVSRGWERIILIAFGVYMLTPE